MNLNEQSDDRRICPACGSSNVVEVPAIDPGRGGSGPAQPPLRGMVRCLDCRGTGKRRFGGG